MPTANSYLYSMADVHDKATRSYNMNIELDTFLSNDQPVTCPYCGKRSNWLANFSHTNAKRSIHECTNHENEYLFIVEDDETIK